MRNIVNGLLVRNDEVLLARRNEARKAYPGLWSFPGGHVERGETLLAALHRELAEEIGIHEISSRFLLSFSDSNALGGDAITYHLYVVDQWDGVPAIQDDEHSALTWFAFDEAADLPDLALSEYRAVLLALQQS